MARVLVVDDTPSIRFLIRTNLELAGHEVTEVSDGRACLETLAREPFDVVTIDAVMPELDGYTTVARIRATPRTADQRIVMVTTQSQTADLRRGREVGVDAYIVKPFDPDRLVEVVEGLLRSEKTGARRPRPGR